MHTHPKRNGFALLVFLWLVMVVDLLRLAFNFDKKKTHTHTLQKNVSFVLFLSIVFCSHVAFLLYQMSMLSPVGLMPYSWFWLRDGCNSRFLSMCVHMNALLHKFWCCSIFWRSELRAQMSHSTHTHTKIRDNIPLLVFLQRINRIMQSQIGLIFDCGRHMNTHTPEQL